MVFIDSSKRQTLKIGQEDLSQTKPALEIAQHDEAIERARQEIEAIYVAIGRAYFEKHKDDTEAEERTQILQIVQLLNDISQHESQIQQLKEIRTCSKCGAKMSSTAKFCNACGAPATQPVPQETTCVVCGAPLGENDNFCINCGAKIVRDRCDHTQEKSKTVDIFCPNCGIKVDSDSLFCPECGSRIESSDSQSLSASKVGQLGAELGQIPQSRKCLHCFAVLEEGDLFCPQCGNKIP